ncbi:MAG: uracil phosphoribosyltransferase [bacterium]|jgi:uracil phosphoribosyltransferase
MSDIYVCDHPLLQHKLAFIRDKNTGAKEFRELVAEVAMLLAYEVTRDLALTPVTVETPMGPAAAKVLGGKKICVVPILRAGLGMVDGIVRLIPAAKVGHLGMYRDHVTLQPVEYFWKLPADVAERDVILVDPMLATGGSAAAGIDFLRRQGAKNIKFMCLIAAPEGVRALREHYPEVPLYTAAVDSHLNEHGYIIPGLGDAGDRLFGTK